MSAASIAITGLGAVCALAEDCDDLWHAVERGRTGIRSIRRFSTDGFGVHLGATVERWSAPQVTGRVLTETLCRCFGERAAREALSQAAGNGPMPEGGRVALVFGTGIADLEQRVHEIAEGIADDLRVLGPRITVSTACSSSTSAIGFARDLIEMGVADVVLAGGADVLTPEVFAGFHSLGVLSPSPCAPFSTPPGTTLGEGAGFLVLEREDRASARNVAVIARLTGFGLSGDGWHETSPDPKGAGVERAIRGALSDAGLTADDVGYVNTHGSGTEANDHSEWLGLQRVLGSRARTIPVSSTKGALGHAQGAAGVLEAIVTLLAAQRDTVPPTLNFTEPRPHGPADPVASASPRRARWDHALSTNSAFGGSNAALVFSRVDVDRPARQRQRVGILGFGFVGPAGAASSAPDDWNAVSETGRRVPTFAFERLVPGADPRGLDPASRFLTGAAALALRDAGVAVRGPLRERIGLMSGQLRGSAASILAFQHSIEARGLLNLSPTMFARIVLNSPAGFCSKLLSLRGPLSVVTTGNGSGLAAILLSAWLLRVRGDVDLMLAGACDEHEPDDADTSVATDEGAGCLLLGNECGAAHASSHTPRAWLAGWGIAGPGLAHAAIAHAACGTCIDPTAVPVFAADDARGGPATGAMIAIAAAVQQIEAGDSTHALVVTERGRSLAAALLLEGTGIER